MVVREVEHRQAGGDQIKRPSIRGLIDNHAGELAFGKKLAKRVTDRLATETMGVGWFGYQTRWGTSSRVPVPVVPGKSAQTATAPVALTARTSTRYSVAEPTGGSEPTTHWVTAVHSLSASAPRPIMGCAVQVPTTSETSTLGVAKASQRLMDGSVRLAGPSLANPLGPGT